MRHYKLGKHNAKAPIGRDRLVFRWNTLFRGRIPLQNFTFSVIIIRNREFAKPNTHEAAKFTRLTADTAFLTLNIR